MDKIPLPSVLIFKKMFLGLGFLLFTNITIAQNFQIGISTGPSANYVHEHYYGDSDSYNEYYEGISFQTDFTFLDSNKMAKYGLSLYSNSVRSYFKQENGYYSYNGMLKNTGLVVFRYFEKQLFKKVTANLQLGTGLNLEADYMGATDLMLNITAGAEVKYAITDNWFLLLKGLAVGQDLPNIVRYFTYGNSQVAGEDLHLISLFGVATNISRK